MGLSLQLGHAKPSTTLVFYAPIEMLLNNLNHSPLEIEIILLVPYK